MMTAAESWTGKEAFQIRLIYFVDINNVIITKISCCGNGRDPFASHGQHSRGRVVQCP